VKSRYRWYVATVFFLFMLLHQADKLLIGPLTSAIMEDFQINEAQMGAVSSLAIIVASVLYPVWGYLYDRYARPKLLALASFIWGATTWLNALAPTYPAFLVTRSTTGIDDSSYPGVFSLLSDYFPPAVRGKVYGFVRISGPLGFMIGTVLATMLGGSLGWRNVFLITGSLGIAVALLILFTVRDRSRGSAEPEMEGLQNLGAFTVSWSVVRGLLRNRTYLFLIAQGFFGVFPWNVLTFWFFRYLETERGYSGTQAMTTMLVAIVALSAGYYLGGYLGDLTVRRSQRGRIAVSVVGVIAGAVFLLLTLFVPLDQPALFIVLLSVTSVAMPFAASNVMATVHDITLPEVRGTAQAVWKLIEDGGSALAPWVTGVIAMRSSLRVAILLTCIATWIACGLFLALSLRTVAKDSKALRDALRERAESLGAA
jgi:MFS family permease